MKQRSINTFFAKAAKGADDAKGSSQGISNSKADDTEDQPSKNVKRRRLQQSGALVDTDTNKEKALDELLDNVDPPAKQASVVEDISPSGPNESEADAVEPAAPKESEADTVQPAASAKPAITEAQKSFASMFKQPTKKSASSPASKKPAKPQREPESPASGAKAATTSNAREKSASPSKSRRSVSPPRSPSKNGSPKKASAASPGSGGDDPIEFTDDDEPGMANEVGKKKRKAAAKKKGEASPGKKAVASTVDGVGQGAISAAAKHSEVDVEKLVDGKWKAGSPVPYAFLADTFEDIAQTTKRLEITHLLISCFRAILATTPEDLLPAVYMCVNRVAPAHMGVELGVGESILIKALASATGRTEARIKDDLRVEGDLGILAVKARSTQKTLFKQAALTVKGVFKSFQEISTTSGQNSQKRKEGLIVKMLASSSGNETGYVMRSLQAKLRIGLAEQSVLVALAHAVELHNTEPKELKKNSGLLAEKLERAAQIVKVCYSECPSYDLLIPALLKHGFDELHKHCHFMPGVPIKPMLAKATNGVEEVLEKFGAEEEFSCEYKYDGERAQVHVLEDGTVMIFSRNAENNTPKYPDIVQGVKLALKEGIKSIVFDSEAVAWDREKKRILPFQVLSTRKRKDVDVSEIQVQVCIFAFDCLYVNGCSLLREPLIKRREAMYAALQEREGEFRFATEKTSKDVEELAKFLDDAVEDSTEGLIVKTLHDTYEPAKRSSHWLKLKKDYMDGVGDTFDVVPIGAFHGKGKRTGLYGAYLLSVYDPESETYQTISKLGTGFTEEVLQQLTDTMKPHVIKEPRKYYTFGETLEPDVWFDAAVVWEVKAADLSISPVHKAGMDIVEPGKGISIRFPRLIRVRDDKGPEDATTGQQVADMYNQQASVRQGKKASGPADDEDDY